MQIAIAGAAGTSGRAAVAAAEKAGYDVVGLSRSIGVDLHTGEGLDDVPRLSIPWTTT